MTKLKVGIYEKGGGKADPESGVSDGAEKPIHIGVNIPRDAFPSTSLFDEKVSKRQQECWYVWSILASVFCCLPCGLIGLVHAMIAKHEGEKGNFSGQKRRLYQAKCWTSWSIVLGLIGLGLTIFAFYLLLISPAYSCSYYETGCSYNVGTKNDDPLPASSDSPLAWETVDYRVRTSPSTTPYKGPTEDEGGEILVLDKQSTETPDKLFQATNNDDSSEADETIPASLNPKLTTSVAYDWHFNDWFK